MNTKAAIFSLLLSPATLFGLVAVPEPGFAQVTAAAQTTVLEFGDKKYVHRWSRADQHEFTPEGQDNLTQWREMLTLNVHKSVSNPDQLALLANQTLERYKAAGKVLAANSLPRTEAKAAQHLIVALLRGTDAAEAVFARFVFLDGRGIVIVYSRREYGQAAPQAIADWIQKGGSDSVNTVMKWSAVPSQNLLDQLPTSNN